MNLKEKIQKKLKEAIKNRQGVILSVLRLLKAAILNKEKEKRYKLSKDKPGLKEEELEKESQLTNEEIINVIWSEAKKRKEAVAEFEKGERMDLAIKEKAELKILEEYLPEQISEEEIKKMALESVKKTGAKDLKDIGKTMADLIPKIKGKADAGTVSKIVKELLMEK